MKPSSIVHLSVFAVPVVILFFVFITLITLVNRATLRRHGCLQILLHHLSSPSLTVVSNACGTLWNLSARCKEDQATLRDLGAIPMLRSLVHSRHKMIAMGSSAALKNLDSSAVIGASMVGTLSKHQSNNYRNYH